MRPLRFAFGEWSQAELTSRTRHAFDHLYEEPHHDFKFNLSAKLPKDDYSAIPPFANGALLKSIGNFGVNINRAFDPDNQIEIYIPDPAGRTVIVYGDNILATQHVQESVQAILDEYAKKRRNKDFNPQSLVATASTRAKRFIDCMKAFTSAGYIEPAAKSEPVPAPVITAEELMARYMRGFSIDRLTQPEKDTACDSFDLDYAFKEIRPSEFEKSEADNARSNMPYFEDEKKESAETLKAFENEWNPNYFEGGKASYFQKWKNFIQSELGVTVSISEYLCSRIELRGPAENVRLAKRIGIRAIPLINAGEPIDGKFGRAGKPLDKEWLNNALADARKHFALQKTCVTLGVIPNRSAERPVHRKTEPKNYPDFRIKASEPA